MKKVTKAVIAAAGYGTRFLPVTKSLAKEMLPIVDKPTTQYLVEEAVESGIKDIFLVTRIGQSSFENHFDVNFELENVLETNGKADLLKKVRDLSRMANFVFLRQRRNLPYGNGTPLLVAKDFIREDERFVYMFADDLVISKKPCSKQLIELSDKKNGAVVIAAQEVPLKEVYRYGMCKFVNKGSNRLVRIIEKPDPKDTPSRSASFGRYVLNHKVVEIINNQYKKRLFGKNKELWTVDALTEYAKQKPVYVAKVEGEWWTTGDPLNYMKTQVRFALEREDIGKDFAKFLKSLKYPPYSL